MPDPHTKTPAQVHGESERETEIGGTAGQSHLDVLTRTLGRDEGLAAATGLSYQKPLVVGGDPATAAATVAASPTERPQEAGTGNATPERPVNDEINDKKLERHGNVGDAARVNAEGRPTLGDRTA